MTAADAELPKQDEILALAAMLAEQILAAQSEGQPFTQPQFNALVSATRFLHENNVPWPPIVQQALDLFAEQIEAIKLEPSEDEAQRWAGSFEPSVASSKKP
ncbi:hypothetical protein [Methylobacterium sp. 285MFTsu5.1]|uniref:hypothetical protein n=1 Tax=Methylobacterium sp. 285MFTsu5.1 TaxID=1172187 RepID=UPI000363BBB5|nr:hypothetical protein [Methylobacterium sp. 285MFTsu5.1]